MDGFTYVAEACSSLQQIVLDDLPTLTDTCVQVQCVFYVHKIWQHLLDTKFELVIVVFLRCKALVSKCRVLTVISLLDSPFLSDVAFKTIAEVISLTKIQIEGLYLCAQLMWHG